MRSTISEKGQITVPKRLRDRLGIRAGDQLEFIEEDGRLIASKAQSSDPVDAMYGILRMDRTTDETIRALRDAPDTV